MSVTRRGLYRTLRTPRAAPLAVILFVALLLRVAFFVNDPNPPTDSGLAAVHGEVARNIVDNGRWFEVNARALTATHQGTATLRDPSDVEYGPSDNDPIWQPEARYMPGISLLLAGIWKATGDQDYGYLQAVQILIDVVLALLVYRISLALFRRPRAALFAAAGYAVLPFLLALCQVPHTDVWAVHGTIILTALTLRCLARPPDARWIAWLGLAAAFFVYFRPSVVIVPAAICLVWTAAPPRRRALAAVVPLVAALLALLPWTIRNHEVFDRWPLAQSGSGQALWEGLGEIPNDFGAYLDDDITYAQVVREQPTLTRGSPEYDAYLNVKARRAIADHPAHYARLIARRVFVATIGLRSHNWLRDLESPGAYRLRTNRSFAEFLIRRPHSAFLWGVYALLEPLLLGIALVTAVVVWSRHRRAVLVLLAVAAATLMPYVLVHMLPRYAAPALLCWLALAGVGVDLALDAVRRRRA